MKIAKSLWETVRLRANFACEFCGVDETGAGAQLTVDHYQPKSKGGLNLIENLIYCCFACNYFKQNYFPLFPIETLLEKLANYGGTEKEMIEQFVSLYQEEKEALQSKSEIYKRLFLGK